MILLAGWLAAESLSAVVHTWLEDDAAGAPFLVETVAVVFTKSALVMVESIFNLLFELWLHSCFELRKVNQSTTFSAVITVVKRALIAYSTAC